MRSTKLNYETNPDHLQPQNACVVFGYGAKWHSPLLSATFYDSFGAKRWPCGTERWRPLEVWEYFSSKVSAC